MINDKIAKVILIGAGVAIGEITVVSLKAGIKAVNKLITKKEVEDIIDRAEKAVDEDVRDLTDRDVEIIIDKDIKTEEV